MEETKSVSNDALFQAINFLRGDLADLKKEVRDLSSHHVTNAVFIEANRRYEERAIETGRRMGEIERKLAELDKDQEDIKSQIDTRFRAVVNVALGALFSFGSGVILLVINLVVK